MKKLRHYLILGVLFVLVTGTAAHFLYNWMGNNVIIGLFTPINESVWEHMKLLYFPMLIYSFFVLLKIKNKYFCLLPSLYLGNLLGTFLIPILFYSYTFITGKNHLILDISVFILSTIIAFLTVYKFTLSCKLKEYRFLVYSLFFVVFLCFIVFSYYPPEIEIFTDPTT